MKFTTFFVFAILVGLAIGVSKDFCWNTGQRRKEGKPACGGGLEPIGNFCLQGCRLRGYTAIGLVCYQDCQYGMKDNGTQCLKNSYDRGVGKPVTSCSDKEDKVGQLCYPKCRSGFTFDGKVCMAVCDEDKDYHDDGDSCKKDHMDYHDCKSCYFTFRREDLCTCVRDFHRFKKPSYNRGNGSPLHCADSEVLEAGLCYDRPKLGYEVKGSVVWQRCPSDSKDTGLACTKRGIPREGGMSQCSRFEENNAGTCYTKCQNGLTGNGPMCWNKCPSGLSPCGAGCALNEATCNSRTLGMPASTATAVASIAGVLAGADGLTKATSNSKKVAARAQSSADYTSKIKNYAAIIKKAKEAKNETVTEAAATQMAYDTVGFFMLDASASTEELALTSATTTDPTGVVAAGEAFSVKMCNQL